MNVLIVDDSKAMQNIITKSMKSVGYMNENFIYASDGEEAFRMIRGAQPDLVLCDMHMPKMTGLDLLKKLRSENDSTRVVIVSIDDDPKTLASITAAGGNAYLKKPFTSEQLFHTVSNLLGKTLTKKAPKGRDVGELEPPKAVFERVLSSLAATDVHLVDASFSDVDFDRAPYYGGTFQDDQSRVALVMFLDALAANTVAAIISCRPLKDAVAAAQAKHIDADAKQSLLAYLGLFSGICKPLPSGQLLDVHAQQFAENPHSHLSKHLSQYAETAKVYSINCGPSQNGKIILIRP